MNDDWSLEEETLVQVFTNLTGSLQISNCAWRQGQQTSQWQWLLYSKPQDDLFIHVASNITANVIMVSNNKRNTLRQTLQSLCVDFWNGCFCSVLSEFSGTEMSAHHTYLPTVPPKSTQAHASPFKTLNMRQSRLCTFMQSKRNQALLKTRPRLKYNLNALACHSLLDPLGRPNTNRWRSATCFATDMCHH